MLRGEKIAVPVQKQPSRFQIRHDSPNVIPAEGGVQVSPLVRRGASDYPICHVEPFTRVILSEAKNLLLSSGKTPRNISCFGKETLRGVLPEARRAQGDNGVKTFAHMVEVLAPRPRRSPRVTISTRAQLRQLFLDSS